jgi:hypothetical protein
VNGDGYADLAVGAPQYTSGTGKAYLYHGSAVGLSATTDWSTLGESYNNYFGYSVTSAGDVNSDGFADLVVGAYVYNNYAGKAYVYHGSAVGLSATADWSAVGEGGDWGLGWSVASAGDVNGDGYADLAIGAPGYFGKVYVYHGSAGGLSASADWSAVGIFGWFGWSVASAGDVNGDGYADLAVGAPYYNSYTGWSYVYNGSAEGLSASANWSTVGEAANNWYGASVDSASDVNGDGYADVAVGAYGYNNYTGKAYVYHGSAAPAACTTSCLRVTAIRFRPDLSSLTAVVTIKDENGAAVPSAAVSAHWDLPGGNVIDQTKTTDASGAATFRVKGGPGTYTITITDVTLAGYTFDPLNSTILSKSITK